MLDRLKRIFEAIDQKTLVISFGLAIVFYLWEIFLIGVPHLEWLKYSSSRYNTKYFVFLFSIYIGFFFLTVLYFYVTLISSKTIKFISLGLFAFIVLGEYGYFNALNRFSNPMDLEIAFIGTDLAIKKDAILSYLNWKSIFPIAVLGLAAIYFKSEKANPKFYFFPLLLLLNIISITFVSSLLEKPKKFINDVPQLNAISSFFDTTVKSVSYFTETYGLKREELPKRTENAKPQKNIIFITDESLRASNLSLYGYERDTTPYLKELFEQGKLKKFNSCVSGTTCSVSSGNLMFTGMTIDELPDTDFNAFKRPTIEQYAKEMGYTTYFFDGQMTTYWRGTSDDRKNTDHWKSLMEFSSEAKTPAEIDFEMARQTAQIINSSNGNFIWIWKRGVHFPFFDDFPESESIWKPTTNSVRLDSVSRETLINTYDNGIKYNVDNFFKILVPEVLKNPNNIIVYTSDHGQNLLESGQLVTHCSTSKNESIVPLFLIGGNEVKINPDYKASHANIFPTLLDLMNVPKEMRKYNYADSLLDLNAKSPEHRYYWGMELTSGEKHPFD